LVSKGLPLRTDGKLDRSEALRWIAGSTSGAGGGWDGDHGRASLRERALALLAATAPAVQPVQRAPQADHGADARRVAVDILRRIAAPLEVLGFARVALRAGCSPEQAYVLAGWFAVQPTLNLSEITSDDLVDVDFPEPTEEQWKNLLGGDFDFDAAGELENEVTRPEIDPAREPEA
jgi:hypothetical protein